MATYKKRGYKPKNKKDENLIDESKYKTAEVLNTLDETAMAINNKQIAAVQDVFRDLNCFIRLSRKQAFLRQSH